MMVILIPVLVYIVPDSQGQILSEAAYSTDSFTEDKQ